mgnify:CR=1 FL=1
MTGYYDEPDDGYDDGEVSGPVEDPEFDASPAPVPDRRYRSTTGDPTFGFILAVAISIGLAPLVGSGDPSMRYTVALAPYERQVPLALENIPVPGF